MLNGTILQTNAERETEGIPSSFQTDKEGQPSSAREAPIVISRERQPELRREPEATASLHGMTTAELKRLSSACHFLSGEGAGLYVSLSCCGASEAEMAALSRLVKSDLAKYQRDAKIACSWVEVRQSTPEPHAHIVSVWPTTRHRDNAISKLRNGRHAEQIWVEAVFNWRGLVGYLAKEATSQAWYASGRNFRRLRKSERAAPISGDSVRISRSLKAELIQRGDIEPYKRTYVARVNLGKPNNINGLTIQSNRLLEEPLAGNFKGLGLLNYTPGEQLALFPDAPVIDLRAAAEARRKELGISQREAAKLAGIRRSQGRLGSQPRPLKGALVLWAVAGFLPATRPRLSHHPLPPGPPGSRQR